MDEPASPEPRRRISRRAKIAGALAGAAILVFGAIGVVLVSQQVDVGSVVQSAQQGDHADKADSFVIDERTVPSESLRKALLEQVDLNGDGIVTPDESSQVSGVSLGDGGFVFYRDDEAPAISIPGAPASEPSRGGGSTPNDTQPINPPEDPSPMVLPELDWSGVTSLDCRDEGLAELDLSRMPNLQYVDCRGNEFPTLDLSNNKAITTLYCDDDVEVTGLEQAGLYFTDLLVSASYAYTSKGSKDAEPIPGYEVAYDKDGRPLSVTSTIDGHVWASYVYDSAGNLVEKTNPYGVKITYEYDAEGRLSAERADGKPVAAYQYDAKGRLIEMANESYGSDISYTYEGNTVVANNKGVETTYRFNNEGLLENQTYNQTSIDYGYDEGRCNWFDSKMVSPSSTYQYTVSVSFDEKGFPSHEEYVVLSQPGSNKTEHSSTYSCNRDGYITSSQSSYDTGSSSRISVSYVKRVGALVDRGGLKRVPSLFVCAGANAPGGSTWFSSNGSEPTEIGEMLPEWKTKHAQGFEVALLQSPNEAALDAYDREQNGLVPQGDDASLAASSEPSGGTGAPAVDEASENELSRFMGVPCSEAVIWLGEDPTDALKEVTSFSITQGPLVISSYEKAKMSIPVVDRIELSGPSEYQICGLTVSMDLAEAEELLRANGWVFSSKSDFSPQVWYEKSGVPYRMCYMCGDDKKAITHLSLYAGK